MPTISYEIILSCTQRTDIVQKVAEVTKKSKFGSVSMRFQSKKNPIASKSVGSNLNVPGGSKAPSARISQGMLFFNCSILIL